VIKEQIVQIIVDHREGSSGIPSALEDLGAEVIIKTLEVGDYHVSNDVIIERKTTSDFLHSIIDEPGHLYGQLSDMMREYNQSILMIEGAPMDLYTERAIDSNAIDGMILAAARFGASMIWTLSADHTARMIYREAEHEQVDQRKNKGSPHGKRSHLSVPQQQEYVVSSICDIGPTLAENLLKHFGTVERIMTASIDELVVVDKVGKTKANRIREIVGGEYKS
jgi:Fanconi anemia group M protein